MRPIILLGGIHDGLEMSVSSPLNDLVLYASITHTMNMNPTDLFPTEYYPPVDEELVTYSNTGMKNKGGRWIFQII